MFKDVIVYGATSNYFTIDMFNAITGMGMTALTNASSGLILTIQASNGAPTVYTVAAGNVEDITTLRTFAQPSTGKIRFKKIDDTNKPGSYEIQIRDDILPASPARWVEITWAGVSNLLNGSHRVLLTGQAWTATLVNGNALQLNGSATAAVLLAASALGISSGTVTGASPTTTTLVDSALGGLATDFYKNAVLLVTSGAQAKQRVQVTGYNGGTNTLTFTALTGAMAQGDSYVLL